MSDVTVCWTRVECRLLVKLPGRGAFFGLMLYDNYVYYTDWQARSLSVFSLDTGRQQSVISGLMRPARFVLHHPRNVSGSYPLSCSDAVVLLQAVCVCV